MQFLCHCQTSPSSTAGASVELVSQLCVCVYVRRAMLDVMVLSEKRGQTDFL